MGALDPDLWRKMSPYLDEALEIEPHQREAWLTSLGATHPDIAAALKMLLDERGAIEDSRFLEGVVQVAVRPAAPSPSLSGQVLGAYRLLSPIGQGGMGTVWLAERCDGRFEGRAAVKLLNAAVTSRESEERFRREGNILARLTHANIARLLDAGVSPTGQPYLVIEPVDGHAIDHYCDKHTLSVDARLRLFLDVLEAVSHAHTNLVVHRDLKPGNVLVSVDGHVKLLDFGIAKLLADDDDGRSRDTWAATPQYAAPEQLAGGIVTTATDVYALGVLLFVLLTGTHPAGTAVRSPATLMQAIVEVPPRRPSDVIAEPDTPGTFGAHAARCGTTASRLRRILRGDLDTIIAKALKKDAAERYASVTALADDIRRFLRREPITARPDSLSYRTVTFVKRHARGVAASAAVVALLAALTAYHTMRLETERDRAQREAAKARKASEVLTGLLTAADPYDVVHGSRVDPTIRDVLDAGADQVKKDLAGQPELQAGMLTVLGRIYRRLGIYDRAQPLLEQALASGNAAFHGDHADVAQTLHDLGVVLADKGDYADAAPRLEQALAMRRRLLGYDHADVAVTLSELGRVYQDLGLNQRAEPLQREALRIRRTVLGEDHRETAVSLSDLASVLRLNGDLAGAEALLTRCLEMNRRTRGEIHPNTSATLHDLALIAAARRDEAGAEAMLRRALDIAKKTLGEKHPVVATTLNSLAHVLVSKGRLDEAAAALQESLAIARPALGSNHQLVAIYAINLAAVQLTRNDAAAAEELLKEALPIRTRAPGLVPSRRRTVSDDDWSVAGAKALLGSSLVAQRRYADAEVVLLEARRDLEAQTSPSARDVKTTIGGLARLYEAWGKHEAAAAYRARLAS